jgi:hypothetical protein
MISVDSSHLTNWASHGNAQSKLPELIRKLILETAFSIEHVSMPSGSSINQAGWDGEVILLQPINGILPAGKFYFEVGVATRCRVKANADYNKRTNDTCTTDKKDSTFVFVTPRHFHGKNQWVAEKKAEEVWRSVKVIDADDLVQWIEQTISTKNWFLVNAIGKLEIQGTRSSHEWLDKYSQGDGYRLTNEFFIGGRKYQAKQIIDSVKKGGIHYIKSRSRDESTAFILSALLESEDKQFYESKVVLLTTSDSYDYISNQNSRLILVPLVNEEINLNYALNKGHTVLCPVGPEFVQKKDTIIDLPIMDRDHFVKSLMEVGWTKEKAEIESRETTRDLSIFRRRNGFNSSRPFWATAENLKLLLPAFFVGKWSEKFDGDMEVIAALSGEFYYDYQIKLAQFTNVEDAPLISIDGTWRVVSPTDVWNYAGKYLNNGNLDCFRNHFSNLFSYSSEKFKLPSDERPFMQFRGYSERYSSEITKGALSTLIIFSVYDKKLGLLSTGSLSLYVDSLLRNTLRKSDINILRTFSGNLEKFAEASPRIFFDYVESNTDSLVQSLFTEEKGWFTNISYHTGLLWALEALAWLPDYFSRSVLLLAKLNEVDPGGTISNRPINSLKHIFKSWIPQTHVSLSIRLDVLESLIDKHPETAWELLLSMCPSSHDHSMYTNKFTMRDENHVRSKEILWSEIWETHSFAARYLLMLAVKSEEKLIKLINVSPNFGQIDREMIINGIIRAIRDVDSGDYFLLWSCIRCLISEYRSHDWGLSEEKLQPYIILNNILQPKDSIKLNSWLFQENVQFIEGYKFSEETFDAHQLMVKSIQIGVLSNLIQEFEVLDLLSKLIECTDAFVVGNALAKVEFSEEQLFQIIGLFGSDNQHYEIIISCLFFVGTREKGASYGVDIYRKFMNTIPINSNLNKILIFMYPSRDLWHFIDLQSEETRNFYWSNFNVHVGQLHSEDLRIIAANLMNVGRGVFFFKRYWHQHDSISTNDWLTILLNIRFDDINQGISLQGYELDQIFKDLYNRADLDYTTEEWHKIECKFLGYFTTFGVTQKPKAIFTRLISDSNYYYEYIKLHSAKIVGYSNPELSRISYELLELLDRLPKGTSDDETDYMVLKKWIDEVRGLASKDDILVLAEVHLGNLLGRMSRLESEFPPESICILLEELDSKSLYDNFRSGIFNIGGVTSRGAFDGGDIERARASSYKDIADGIRNRFPNVAGIFDDLEQWMLNDAIRFDNEAIYSKLEY